MQVTAPGKKLKQTNLICIYPGAQCPKLVLRSPQKDF